MKSRYLYYCLFMAVFITGLYQFFMPNSAFVVEQHMKPGQIAEKDIIAPFDFPILKPDEVWKEEQKAVTAAVKPVFQSSDEIQFDILKQLNEVFEPLMRTGVELDSLRIRGQFDSHNIKISHRTAQYLENAVNRRAVYTLLVSGIEPLYRKGVYNDIGADSIVVYIDGEPQKLSTKSLLAVNQAKAILLESATSQAVKSILEDILPQIIKPNLIKDQLRQNELVEQALSSVNRTDGIVAKNEIIVRRNNRITNEEANKIRSLAYATEQNQSPISSFKSFSLSLSIFLYMFALGVMLWSFCKLYYPMLLERRWHFAPILGGMTITATLALVNNQLLGLQTLLIPYSFAVITSAILLDIPFAIFYNFLSFAAIYPFVNWETFSPLVLVLATFAVLLMLSRLNDKHQYLSIWFYLVASTLGLTIIFSLYKNDSLAIILGNLGYAFISATLSLICILMILPFMEKKWNMASKRVLLELLDFTHPLLKQLATNAVGTYHHSLIVGNLAERSAEAIGANPLLARVGSYYHDIGKITNPEIFTENNDETPEIHDNLPPSQSAAMIINHVKEGLILARKYKLPEAVIEIIEQHHGSGYIRYFLDKAERSRQPINLDAYKYGGPKPQSKESAIVMIADIVESTTKSWADISEDEINKILDNTVLRLIKEGQFDDSDITLQDLAKVKKVMLPILQSIYRKRLQYPEPKEQNA